MKRFAVVLVVSGAIAAVAAPVASAVTPHRHYVITPDGGAHEIGPPACDNQNAQPGFDSFHQHMHLGQPREAFANPQNPVVFIPPPHQHC